MSVEASAWALKQTTGSVAHKAVLLALADRASFEWTCYPSQKTIARETELGPRTVRRILADLEDRGFITREHRYRQNGDGGRHQRPDHTPLSGQIGRYPAEGVSGHWRQG